MCRIPETYPDNRYSSSDEEYFDGYISEPSTLHMKPKNMFAMKRTGGSLSLSENEIDSDDLEMPVPFSLSEKTRERLNSASRSNKTKEELLEAVATNGNNSKNSSPSRNFAAETGGKAESPVGDNQEEEKKKGSEEDGVDSVISTEDYVEILK